MTPVAQSATPKSAKTGRLTKVTYNYTAKDRECLKRAMYFESQHSDHDGYMAVGTVVMNRLTSNAYAPSICGIVAQKKQFAPGVMTRPVVDQAQPDLDSAADALLVRGERNPSVKDAMFFHTQGLSFPYDNMHYTAVAGGNAFYEKRDQNGVLETAAPLPSYEVAMNYVSDQAFGLATNYVTPPSTAPEAVPFLLPSAVPVPILTPPPAGANVAPEMTASVNVQPMPVAQPIPAAQPVPAAQRLAAAAPVPEPAADAIQMQIPTVVAVPLPRPPTMAMTFAKVGN